MRGKSADNINHHVGDAEFAIELTTLCNSSCKHCFARLGISRDASLPVDLVKEIISDGYEVGYRHLHLTGGEPLLWQGLFEALDYGFSVGYETIFMNTNGTLISDEISKRFANYDNFSFSVSLDGHENQHDRQRGKGSYRRAMRGIETALKRGNDLTIFTTVSKSLLPDLPYFVDAIYKAFPVIDGIILIQLLCITNDAFTLSDELLDPEDFIRLVRMVSLLNVGGLRAIVKKNPIANVVLKFIKMPIIPQAPPLYSEGSIIVMANRHIGVVHSNRDSFGKYRRGMIQKVLASDVYRKTVAPDQATCPSCRYSQLCKEYGMIRPTQGYDDRYADTPFCKRVMDRVESTQAATTANLAENFARDRW